MNSFDHVHFLCLIIYEEMKYSWLLVSGTKGWDLRCSGLCLHFYDSCLLCWFSEMHSQGKKLKTSSDIYYLIFHSSRNEIRQYQWSEMCLFVTIPAFSFALIFLRLEPSQCIKTSLLSLSFLFFLGFKVHQMINACISLSPELVFSFYTIPEGDLQSNTLHTLCNNTQGPRQ